MRVATWAAGVAIAVGLAILVGYWMVLVLSALFGTDEAPGPRQGCGARRHGGRGGQDRGVAPSQRHVEMLSEYGTAMSTAASTR